MSQSSCVLIAVGNSPKPKLPKQNYKNVFTKYNIGALQVPDSHFYNKTIQDPDIPDQNSFDIYGFLPGNAYYTNSNSIQQIVSFFNQHKDIEIITCDINVVHKRFKRTLYVQPQVANDIPFFVRSSVINKINFVNEPPIFQHQLERLKSEYIIFHIATPLISLAYKGSG
tara:strand:- start:460 stop:966 length:507 start_codon:yes stop_codon:yes gene_type:complete